MNKILVIDDDITINELVKINLELVGYTVFSAENGDDGFALAKQELPDLIILDVMMPKVDGFTVAKRIRENTSTTDTPILMLTALSQLSDKVKGFDIGVDDYLVKPFEIDELLVRVRALLKRGNSLLPSLAKPEIHTIGDLTLDANNLNLMINSKIAKLTPTEFDIINILVQNHGQIVQSSVFLKQIWGYAEDDDVETVRVHVRHLRSKIEKISPKKKYIQTIYGGGYPTGI